MHPFITFTIVWIFKSYLWYESIPCQGLFLATLMRWMCLYFSLIFFLPSVNILSPICRWRCHVCWELVEHHSSSHLLSFSIPWKSDRSFACWKGHWFPLLLLAATKWDILIAMITRSRPRKSAPFLLTRQYFAACDNYFESPIAAIAILTIW